MILRSLPIHQGDHAAIRHEVDYESTIPNLQSLASLHAAGALHLSLSPALLSERVIDLLQLAHGSSHLSEGIPHLLFQVIACHFDRFHCFLHAAGGIPHCASRSIELVRHHGELGFGLFQVLFPQRSGGILVSLRLIREGEQVDCVVGVDRQRNFEVGGIIPIVQGRDY